MATGPLLSLYSSIVLDKASAQSLGAGAWGKVKNQGL